MKHYKAKCRVDPVLAPDQFSVARPLQPEDLDRRVTQQGIYPSLPAPNGVPWSEYVRMHRNRARSISSSTEALESDHARYVTRKIVQHARLLATHMRSLPTDSPIPYIQSVERGYMSEGSQENMYAIPYVDPSEHMITTYGADYHSEVTETDGVLTFTGLDDYDMMFAARHVRGALDPTPKVGKDPIMTSIGIPTPMAGPELINMLERKVLNQDDTHLGPEEQISLTHGGSQVISPSSKIIVEGATIFMDMTNTILDVLDKQIAAPPGSQHQTKELSLDVGQIKGNVNKEPKDSSKKEDYPNLFLAIRENYRISDHFHGYLDSLSVDHNPMVLVELNNLSHRYGTLIYEVDRVNGTMYGKFSIGYRMIPEKATVIPQYHHTLVIDEYEPAYENTIPEVTNIPTPMAQSTPVTQASQVPMTKIIQGRDIVRPMSGERARATYLDRQIQEMGSVQLLSNVPPMKEESHVSTDLTGRINRFCKE